jgi:hypothetical protein
MFETFFGFKKVPFSDEPDARQLFEYASWKQVQARLKFLIDHRGAGLLTGEVGSGKSTAARTRVCGIESQSLQGDLSALVLRLAARPSSSDRPRPNPAARTTAAIDSAKGEPHAGNIIGNGCVQRDLHTAGRCT